jgi:hypothetical protein
MGKEIEYVIGYKNGYNFIPYKRDGICVWTSELEYAKLQLKWIKDMDTDNNDWKIYTLTEI